MKDQLIVEGSYCHFPSTFAANVWKCCFKQLIRSIQISQIKIVDAIVRQ